MPALDRERVRVASAVWVFVPATAPRVETDDYLLVRYPDWFERPVQMVRLHTERPLDEVVAEAVEHARAWVDPALPATAQLACWERLDAPAGLERALRDAGAVLDETVDVLAMDLADFDPGVLDLPSDLGLGWSNDFEVMVAAAELGAEVFGGARPERDALAELDVGRTGLRHYGPHGEARQDHGRPLPRQGAHQRREAAAAQGVTLTAQEAEERNPAGLAIEIA